MLWHKLPDLLTEENWGADVLKASQGIGYLGA